MNGNDNINKLDEKITKLGNILINVVNELNTNINSMKWYNKLTENGKIEGTDYEIADDGDTYKVKTSLTLPNNFIIPEGKTITNEGTITNDGTITNNGTIDNTEGTLTNNGTITGNQPIQWYDAILIDSPSTNNYHIPITYAGNTFFATDNGIILPDNFIIPAGKKLEINHYSYVRVTGTLTNKGIIDIHDYGQFLNSGTINNEGIFGIASGGSLNNDGIINNTNTGMIINAGGQVRSSALGLGTINNNGRIFSDVGNLWTLHGQVAPENVINIGYSLSGLPDNLGQTLLNALPPTPGLFTHSWVMPQ